jgi:signal transduction histidine kinase/ligand-binding sensor domain-containing protein
MLTSSSASAAETIRDLQAEFLIEYHQTEQGLPDNFINNIAQTPDGYLWVATFNGLARYNGVQFVSFDSANTPELASSRTTRLLVDRAGQLWIKSENSNLTVFGNGRFRSLGPNGHPLNVTFSAIELNRAGEVVTSYGYDDTNLFRFTGQHFERVQGSNTFVRTYGLMQDRAGVGWTINDKIESPRLRNTDPRNPVDTPIPNFLKGRGWRLHGSVDGGLWVLAGAFRKFKDGQWEYWGELPFDTDQFGGFTEDHQGNFWVGVSGGELWRLGTNRVVTRFKLPGARISELGRTLFCDAENNLWVGTGGIGLLRLKPRLLKSINSESGLSNDVTRSVTEDNDGNIWVATVNTVDRIHPATFEIFQKQRPEIQLAWIVQKSREGGLWIGTYDEGLFYFGQEGASRLKIDGTGKWPPMNLSLLESRAGITYLGTAAGLFEARTNTLVQIDEEAPKREARAMVEDAAGNIYFALHGQGLLRKSGDAWECFTRRDGLISDQAWALHLDKEQSLWIGTEGGLTRLKGGKFYNFSQSAVSLPRFINCLVEDNAGSLWFGSNRGIFSAKISELNALADGRASSTLVNHFDRSDGMGSSQCTGSACKARDGRLWFTTMNGVAIIDPASLPRNSRPPPVVIEETLIDDKAVGVENNELTIPPGAHRVEIRFAGLSFTAPERVHLRYRLHGIDRDWVDSTRRSAFYTRLEPGNYRFEVIASNNDGVWNESGAALAMIAQPFFWQRASVQAAAALTLLAGAIALARYWSALRVRRRVAELERRHVLDRERGRISRDLHDSLGADLSQLALWTDLALQEQNRPAAMVQHTRNASSLAREVIQNVEEIVWTVNPRNDSLDRFVAYLCEFSERLVTRAGLRFRWEAPDQIPPFPLASDIRHHLFLATKEALNNIIKHAHATETRVQITATNGQLEISISDDGRGFDETKSSNRNGLRNLSERVSACGGELLVQSGAGKGTSIRLRIPLVEPVNA